MADLSDALNSLQNGIIGISTDIKEFVGTPLGAAIGGATAGAVIGGTVVGIASRNKTSTSSTSRKRKKISHTKRGWKQDRKRRSKQKWEVAYQKRKRSKKSRSKKGIHYTKNGQPYKILASGKARFVKR